MTYIPFHSSGLRCITPIGCSVSESRWRFGPRPCPVPS